MSDHATPAPDPDDRVRAALGSAVPTPPPAPDRAAEARAWASRRRRRRTTAAVLGAAAVVAAIAVLPGALGGSGSPGPAAPTTSTPTPDQTEPRGDLVCPRVDPAAAADGPAEIGGGVVGARLCSSAASGFDAPDVEISAGDAADIAASIDRLEMLPAGTECTQPAPRPFVIVFQRADSSTTAVYGSTTGCDAVVVGGVQRRGASGVLETALATARGAEARRADPGCPPAPVTAPNGPDVVTPGAVVVRLCQGPGDPIDEPLDALRSGIPGLVDRVNGLPRRDGEGCDGDRGAGFSLVFGYADGSTETVTGEPYGCDVVRTGTVAHVGPEEVLDAFASLLRHQRDRSGDVYVEPREPVCPFDVEPVVGVLVDVRTGYLCFDYGATQPGQPVPLSAEDVLTILTELVQPEVEKPARGCGLPLQVSLVGETAWGDRTVLRAYCGTWIINGKYVEMSPSALELVNRAQRQAERER